jgi:hypothetical protein
MTDNNKEEKKEPVELSAKAKLEKKVVKAKGKAKRMMFTKHFPPSDKKNEGDK